MPTKNDIRRPLTRIEAVILGYGYYRSFTDSPWFTAHELKEAIGQSPLAERNFHYTGLTQRMASLAASECIEYARLERAKQPGQTPYHGRITDQGTQILMKGLVYFARDPKPPLDLPDILQIPQSLDAVVEHSGFQAVLFEAVLGDYQPSTNTPRDLA